MALYPQRFGQADCRDFLRTGRCKYGESCKYHHPTNVQVGGGIRAPLDPSEPQFPIRPDEPHCQYYLKHGTCKFGQTCKFHHPAHLVGVGSNFNNKNNATVSLVPVTSSEGDVVLLLPQRPTEPDCIYFLRNGRCKYGATCKFHHPLSCHGIELSKLNDVNGISSQVHIDGSSNISRVRAFSTGSAHDFSSRNNSGTSLQYLSNNGNVISAAPNGSGNHEGPTHILVSDTPITVMMSGGSDHARTVYRTNGRNQVGRNSHGRSDPSSSSEEQSQNTATAMPTFDSSFNSFEYGGGIVSSGETHATDSQWGPRFPNRQNSMSSRSRSHHYVMVRRSSASDNVFVGEANTRQNFGNESTPSFNVGERRTVSLGSSADMATSLSAEGSNAYSSIQRGWESNASLSTSSSRFWEESNFANSTLIPESTENASTFEQNPSVVDSSAPISDPEKFKNEDGLAWKTNYEDDISGIENPVCRPCEGSNWNGTHHKSAPNLTVGDSSSQNLEDEGLSNMTSALLNMLDKSNDLVSEEKSSPAPKLSSSYPNGNNTISFSDPEFVRVDTPNRRLSAQSISSQDVIRDRESVRFQSDAECVKNIIGTPRIAEDRSPQDNCRIRRNSQDHLIFPPPQSSPSDVGLYLS